MSLLASEGIEPLFRLKKSVLDLERPKAVPFGGLGVGGWVWGALRG